MSPAHRRRTKIIVLLALALAVQLTASPLHASTITFEREFGNGGSVVYSPTREAVTVMNVAIDSLFVTTGILPDPVEYDVDGAVTSSGDPGGAGALEFFLDGCVQVGTLFPFSYQCTPTVASYVQIVGSVPDLGIPQQSLLLGTPVGGASDGFSAPNVAFGSISGGGSDALLSVSLSQALGFDAATAWQFTFVVPTGFQATLRHDQLIATGGEPAPAPVPEPASIVLLGTGVLAGARRLRPRRG
jgi:hypothetical protein